MKFSKLSQLLLVSSIGLLVATLLIACNVSTVDYVYVASSAGSGSAGNGQIDIFAVDAASGALRTGGATVSSGGVNPVSMAVDSAYANLYVAHAGSRSIVHFAIGSGGLTQKESVTMSNTPVAIAVNAANTYLYAISLVKQTSACTLTASGSLTVYPLTAGVIGTPTTLPAFSAGNAGDVIVPTAINVLVDNSAVIVTAYDQSSYNPGCTNMTSNANGGWIFSFTVHNGTLTAAAGSPWQAGLKPVAITSDPTMQPSPHFIYVTDYASNSIVGYTILSGDALRFMTNGPFKTGNEPSSIIIDPRGKFLYLTDALDSTVLAYGIDLATGSPSATVGISGSLNNATDTDPVAITVEPALGRYVYTANYLGNSVSGFRLDPTSGALTANQASPYPTDSKPTAIISIPNGNHATQSVGP
jgi:6-phosphogluconolactonase (cycloisomerase 2 family)